MVYAICYCTQKVRTYGRLKFGVPIFWITLYNYNRKTCKRSCYIGPDMFHALGRRVQKSQKDPESWITWIRDPGGPWMLYFHFLMGILEILDSVTATLQWYPRDLGYQTEKMSLDPAWASCYGILRIFDIAQQECHWVPKILYIRWDFASGSQHLCAT